MAIPDVKILSPLCPTGLIDGMGEICFDGYLDSVKSAYQQWWRLYTLTDVQGRELQRVEREQSAPDFFDFGLMVQTVSSQKEKGERQKEEGEGEVKEKIERLPVLEGICKYAGQHDLGNHVLLVGRPGSGKSTALARLLLQEAEKALKDKQAKIPVLVELRYLPSDANELAVCDRILAFMHKHDPALAVDALEIKQLLRQGRLLLLVDGVNELPSEKARHQVNIFRQDFQTTCPMIFTTRELSAGGDLGIAKRLEMQPLTEAQMQQFVSAYLPTQGEKLLRQLSGRLREFGQTPLLLWMLCSLFRQTEQIPPNLGMVFRAFTLGYGDRIKQDVPLYKDSRVWWGRLLQYLAFVMIVGESATEAKVAISRREAERVLVEFLRGKVEHPDDCAIHWLEDLLRHHLLQISNDQIEFRHQLIQEYYAAEWLLGLLPSLSDARLQHDYLNYLKWTEPLALMLELVESEEQAVRVVRLALDVDLWLGARLAGAVKYGFQEETVELLLREIEERKIPQLYAIELVGETKSSLVVEPLIHAPKDLEGFKRWKIAEALGNIISDKAVESLTHALKDVDDWVRSNAAEALGNIVSDKAVEPLIYALKDTDDCVRIKAAHALGKIGSDKAIEPLVHALKDVNHSVRQGAAEALGNIGSDNAVEPLIHAFKDVDNDVRIKAAEALGKLGSDKAVEPLIYALKNADDLVVLWTVAEALGNIGSDKAVESLVHALKNVDPFLGSTVAETLVSIGSDKAVEPLIHALKNAHYFVRMDAALALGKLGSDKAIEPLVHALKDVNHSVRQGAAEALGNIGSDKAVEPLIYALKDVDHSVRQGATQALGNIGGDKVVEPLIYALKDVDHSVRQGATQALGNIGGDKVVEPLIYALKDVDHSVRQGATQALGNIGGDKVVEPLIYALKDVDHSVRITAAEALGNIGGDKVVEPLIHALKDVDHSVRITAAEALGNIGGDKVVEPLIHALKDVDHSVRIIAAAKLGKIDSDKAVEPLIHALKNVRDYVRMRAAKELGEIAEADRNLPTLTQQLPHLLTLIPTESSQEALSVITAIQSHCKYYNYDIAQMTLPEELNNDANPQGNIIHMTEIKNDFSGANFGGANIANLGGTVNEQKIVQKNEVPKQSLAEATKEVQELLNQLAKTNPSEAAISDTIQQEIKRNPTLKARLVNALKTGGIEALKAIFNNPLVSIPVETVKGFLEAES